NYPYFAQNISGQTLYIVITSDRGQAGAFNSNIFNLSLSSFDADSSRPQVAVYGRKGSRFFPHLAGIDLRAAYQDLEDIPETNVFAPIIEMINNGVTQYEFSRVVIIYTQFISSLTQKAVAEQLFPIQPPIGDANKEESPVVYEFEPELSIVLAEASRVYIEA